VPRAVTMETSEIMDNNNNNFYSEITDWIKENKPDKEKLSRHKKDLCKKYKIKEIPTDINIYLNATSDDAKLIRTCLQTKPMRTGSGVTVIAAHLEMYLRAIRARNLVQCAVSEMIMILTG